METTADHAGADASAALAEHDAWVADGHLPPVEGDSGEEDSYSDSEDDDDDDDY